MLNGFLAAETTKIQQISTQEHVKRQYHDILVDNLILREERKFIIPSRKAQL